jgi:release factor glutamine methyltransferase
VKSQTDEGRALAVTDLIRQGARRLAQAHVENPRLDAELLLAEAAGVTRANLFAGSIELDDETQRRFEALIGRRAGREPLAYITGRKEFYSLEFELGPGVLVPRPETETIVDVALKFINGRVNCRLLDIGAGCGAIALAIISNASGVRVVAADISTDALAIAHRNAVRLRLESRVRFVHADCWDTLDGGEPLGRFDIVVSNPPYVCDSEIARLEPEIRDFEPRVALDGGPDGLDFYRRIVAGLGDHLFDSGAVILEVGAGQADAVASILHAAGFAGAGVSNDLSGIARAVHAISAAVHGR